ncbi:MAG: RNA polymerase factor sigma-54, partial [Betaproteobacteria bacterium]|nr:RNA polymerase factor sigma-54 [Betaproteobacteria bacterium]
MKQTLQVRLSQHLTLTPQLQQSIRLLQLSTLELNQELEKFLAENPLLERGEAEEFSPGAPEPGQLAPVDGGSASPEQAGEIQGEDSGMDGAQDRGAELGSFADTASGAGGRDEGEDDDYPQQHADLPTLREHLLAQLALTALEPRDRTLAELLIDAVDEDGYLTQSLEEIAALLPPELEVEPEELRIALRHVQNLEPTGVGARSPAECLELQLAAMPESTPEREHALALVRAHLPLLAARDFMRLKKLLQCTDEQLRQAQELIQSLNPRPGAGFGANETRYVAADVIVKKIKNVWVASLNPDAMPKLRINRMYARILQDNRNAASGQMSQQLQEARWLIKNVQQRFETILRVSQAIVDRQRHFFEHGELAMRPLVLREIADTLGLHESTISRVTTQKYMLTARGIFELKYFFGSHVATDAGGACSATAIRALIRQFVAAEDAKKPLSDSKIAQVLGQQGIVVARRT